MPDHRPSPPTESPAQERPTPRRAGRSFAFFGASLAVHLGLVAALAAISSASVLPRPKVVWLDLDNRLGAPQPKVVQPKPAPPKPAPTPKPAVKAAKVVKPIAKRTKRVAKKPKPKPKPKAKVATTAKRRFATAKVALSGLTPGDAALMLLVRTDRVRKSPYASAVRRLLEVFYDHKTFLWSSGIDPVRDFDALLIATPNPYRVTRTFLAARHRLPTAAVRLAVNKAGRYGKQRVAWSRSPIGLQARLPSPPRLRHDPRVAVVREGLFMLLDPTRQADFLRPATPKADNTKPSARKPAARDDDDDADEPSLIERLQRMDKEGGSRRDDPGLLLQAVNLRRLVRLPPDLPAPANVQVTIPALAPALLRGVLTFASPAEARTFYQSAKKRLEAASRSIMLRLLGVGGYFDRIKIRVAGRRVRARLKLSARDVRDLLEMFRSFIPQVRVPGMAPRDPASRPAIERPSSQPTATPPRVTPATATGAAWRGTPAKRGPQAAAKPSARTAKVVGEERGRTRRGNTRSSHQQATKPEKR